MTIHACFLLGHKVIFHEKQYYNRFKSFLGYLSTRVYKKIYSTCCGNYFHKMMMQNHHGESNGQSNAYY